MCHSVVVGAAAVLLVLLALQREREPYEGLVVGLTTVGRGVFARRAFAKGEVVETCPLIVAPTDNWGPALHNYIFQHGDGTSALPLGLCSLYNHSKTPNLEYTLDQQANTMVTRATRAIAVGEELRISYGPTWFEDRGMQAE